MYERGKRFKFTSNKNKMSRKIFAILTIAVTINVFSQVGINTELPSQTLDVNGSARLRGVPGVVNPPTPLPTGVDPTSVSVNNFPNVLVNRTDGTVGSRSFLQLRNDVRSQKVSLQAANINSSVDLSNVDGKDLADVYIVDSGSNITLPTCGAGSLNGKIIKIYKWGGASTNPIKIIANPQGNIFNAADPSGLYTPPTGILYNNSGGSNGSGSTISISIASNINNLRFTMIRMLCIGENNAWFLDHNVE